MASIEKLVKSFEALKVFQASIDKPEEPLVSSKIFKKETFLSKKDKINHCCIITDIICSPQLRSVEDFQKFLGVAIETLFVCCDDNDSDVRSNANECLNKTINCLLESHLNRIHVELFKEIKKNGSSRCIRAALSRFAKLAHLIRPAKCRPYLENLIPCIVKIVQRTNEDSIQETLSIAIKKLMPVIGPYAFENEIIYLLECFLPNLSSPLSSVRRTAALLLISLCQYSKKPAYFYSWLITSLSKTFHKNQSQNSSDQAQGFQELQSNIFSGIFLCFRHLFPLLHNISYDKNRTFGASLKQILIHEKQMEQLKENLLHSYEIILTTLHTSNDASVILNALEALQQFLKNPPKLLLPSLLDEKGLGELKLSHGAIPSLSPSPPLYQKKSKINTFSSSIENFSSLEDDDEVVIKSLSKNLLSYNNSALNLSLETNSTDSTFLGSINDISKSCDISFQSQYSHNEENSSLLIKKNFPNELTIDSIDDNSLSIDILASSSIIGSGTLENISCKLDDIGEFNMPNVVALEYCLRLLCAKFLLLGVKGGLISDQNVRDSMKCLALNCVGHIMSYYPKGFLLDLRISAHSSEPNQKIWDIALYSAHPDPQVKGQAALVIAIFIENVLNTTIDYSQFLKKNLLFDISLAPSLEELIAHVFNLLIELNNPTNCIRNGLLAFQKCLIPIITANNPVNQLSLNIIDTLIKLKNHNYWLIKVELLSLFCRLPFINIKYLEKHLHASNNLRPSRSYQKVILDDVFLALLSDEDYRVRQSASQCLIKLIPNLYSVLDSNKCDPVFELASSINKNNLSFFSCNSPFYSYQKGSTSSFSTLDYGFVEPFSEINQSHTCKSLIEENLKFVIKKILKYLMQNSDKKFVQFGCIQAFYELSKAYNVITFSDSWGFSEDDIDQVTALLKYFLHLMTNQNFIINDINTLQFILTFVGNMISGLSYQTFKQSTNNESSDDEKNLDWECLSKNSLVLESLLNQLTLQVIKLLRLFASVFNESKNLSISSNNLHTPNSQIIQSLSTVTLNPIRKKNSKSELNKSESNKKTFFEKDKNKSNYQRQSSFTNDPVLYKLYKIFLSIYSSSRTSIDLENHRLTPLLESTLNVLCQLLEIGNIKYFGKYVKEILDYLKVVFFHIPSSSVKCSRQLLKCIFGINFSLLITTFREYDRDHNCDELDASLISSQINFSSSSFPISSSSYGLYQSLFAKPYANFSDHCLSKFALLNSTTTVFEDKEIWHCYFRKCIDKRVSLILEKKSLVNMQSNQSFANTKTSPTSFIRLFEPIVIKSLKFYTMTSDINIQCEVLSLLSHLVKLKVNYCQLDSDLVFLGFVLKQFEYIGSGQILNSQILIDHIFYFLILLSYDRELVGQFKEQDKSIIGIPEIIKMCDDLMASGQPPENYALPALRPIVEDLFLHRAPTKVESAKELEAQREVIISTLLKLANYKKSLKLLNMIVQQSRKEGEEKWRKISRQITDALLPLLIKQNVLIDDCDCLNLIHQIFESVSPTVFRPVDYLLKALFSPPEVDLFENRIIFQRWLSFILVILRILIIHAKEEIVLARLEDIRPSINFLYPSKNTDESFLISIKNCSVSILAIFLFKIIQTCVEVLVKESESFVSSVRDQNKFLAQNISHCLLYLTYMFQSGSYHRVAKRLAELMKESLAANLQSINNYFLKIHLVYPTLMLQWCNVLILLGFDDNETYKFWHNLIKGEVEEKIKEKDEKTSKDCAKNITKKISINLELVKRGTLILLCDFACENFTDFKQLTWLTMNNIDKIVCWSYELPIQDFIHTIHRNQASSKLFLEAIETRCFDFQNGYFLSRLLSCVELSHETQSGHLITLLIEKILANPQTRIFKSIRNSAMQLALTKIKFLFKPENINEALLQLSISDTDKLINSLDANVYRSLHEALKRYRLLISKQENRSLFENDKFNHLSIKCDKDWFVSFLLTYCKHNHPFNSFAFLLNKFNYEELKSLFCEKNCGLNLLAKCFIVTESMTIESSNNQNNQITSLVKNRNVLLKECFNAFLHHLNQVQSHLPNSHYPFVFPSYALSAKELNYQDELIQLFNQKSFINYLFSFASVYTSFLRHSKNSMCFSFTKDNLKTIVRIGVLYAELAFHEIKSNKVDHFNLYLEVIYDLCNCDTIVTLLSSNENFTLLCSLISSVHYIVKFVTKDNSEIYLSKSFQDRFNYKIEKPNRQHALDACRLCIELMILLESLDDDLSNSLISSKLSKYLKKIVFCLCRFPLVNSIAMIPPLLWHYDTWNPELSGEFGTICSTISSDYLCNKEILKQFIFRVECLGWINRVQFEEIWMSLLGVISIFQDTEDGSEEKQEKLLITLMSINGITTLLLQSLRLSQPGNPLKPFFKMESQRVVPFIHTKFGEKLSQLLSYFETPHEEFLENVCLRKYFYKPFHVDYLKKKVGILSSNDISPSTSSNSSSSSSLIVQRSSMIAESDHPNSSLSEHVLFAKENLEIDLNSCIHFLLDLYGQLISSNLGHSPLLIEICASLSHLSNLFFDKAQFEWMLDTFLDLFRISLLNEDDIILQHLSFGICKSLAVLGIDQDQLIEKCKKSVEISLKNSFLPTRINTFHALRYLLEYRNILPGGKESCFLPLVMDYIIKHLNCENLPSGHNEEHVLSMWNLSFHLIETFEDNFSESEFGQKILQLALDAISKPSVNVKVYETICKGLERLILCEIFSIKDGDVIVRTSINKLKYATNEVESLSSVRLIISCIYVFGLSIGNETNGNNTDSNEDLLLAMEKVGVLFDRLKVNGVNEACLLSSIIPNMLCDFFPTQDILNKIIGEFLSSQHVYPQYSAMVIFKVFNNLHLQSQEALIHEWVVLSLSSFIQIQPLSSAIWSLSSFLICASSNIWIKNLFYCLQNRFGKYNAKDEKLFLFACCNFYDELQIKEQKESYLSIFKEIAKPGSIYAKAVFYLQTLSPF